MWLVAAALLLLLVVALLVRYRTFPIDAVVTWVDSTDDEWRRSKAAWQTKGTHQSAVDSERFPESGPCDAELEQCLLSMLRHMPWLNRIHIVTARPQRPQCLERNPVLARALRKGMLTVVHHDQVFEEESNLPTFNSQAIESQLHRIPGLAERFIYFNDDCYVLERLEPEHFFRHGKPLLHAERYAQCGPTGESMYDAAWRNTLRELQVQCAHYPQHWACAMTKQLLRDAERYFAWQATTRSRFRSADNIIPVQLAQLWGLQTGQVQLAPYGQRLRTLFATEVPSADQLQDHQALCINHPRLDTPEGRDKFTALFKHRYAESA